MVDTAVSEANKPDAPTIAIGSPVGTAIPPPLESAVNLPVLLLYVPPTVGPLDVIGAGNVNVSVVVVSGADATTEPDTRMPAPTEDGSEVWAL